MAISGEFLGAGAVNYLIGKIKSEVSKLYTFKGTYGLSELPYPLTADKAGWVFDVYNDIPESPGYDEGCWYTFDLFKDGINIKCQNGTNIAVCELYPEEYALTEDEMVYDPDKIYYESDGEGGYTPVTPDPNDNPAEEGWYELWEAVYGFDLFGIPLNVDTSGFVQKAGDIMTGPLTTTSLLIGSLDSSASLPVSSFSGSFAQGYNVAIGGSYAHAEGAGSKALAYASHVEGAGNTVSANATHSHAEGQNNQVSASASHAEGSGNTVSGNATYSHAEGQNNQVSETTSHVEGYNNTVSSLYSHVEGGGNTTSASSSYSHIEGSNNTFSGSSSYSHAEGYNNTVSAAYSHVEGQGNYVYSSTSHAEGLQTKAGNQNSPSSASECHAEGYGTKASGDVSHAEGYYTEATGSYSHAEGENSKATAITAHAEGSSNTASGNNSHAEGLNNTASGSCSHAEGNANSVSGTASHAEGANNTISGQYANYAHVEGEHNSATSSSAHAEGGYTTASGSRSHAEGDHATASGFASHAAGEYTIAGYEAQTVVGQYNSNKSTTLFEVGNGTSNSYANRSNALEVYKNGNVVSAANLIAGSDVVDGEGNKLSEVGNIPSYIVSGSTAFSAGWLSKSSELDATAFVPVANRTYMVLSAGEYENKIFRWDGTNATYVQVSGASGDFLDEDVIAEEFDATETYDVNDMVLYDHKLYKCTTAHTGAWNASHFTQTTVSDEFSIIIPITNAEVDAMWNGTYGS